MLINNLYYVLLDDDFSEVKAEKDINESESPFFTIKDEDGKVLFYKSISDPEIVYGFFSDEKGWTVMCTKYKIFS